MRRCERVTATSSTEIGQMNEGRFEFAMAASERNLFAFGGINSTGASLSTVESYDPNKDRWSKVKRMFTGRANAAASALGDWIYICGGTVDFEDSWRCAQSCERYNPAQDRWENVSSMHLLRAWYSLVSANGRLYALGGNKGTVEWYDPCKDEWCLLSGL